MTDSQTPWFQEGWLKTVEDWIHAVLEPQGITINGPLEQFHAYPWSTVMRIPTPSGSLFFKATAAYSAHEPALTAYLSKLHPETMPQLLASDPAKGWMIMQDAGQRLREQLQQNPDLRRWEALLPLYGAIQREVAPHTNDLIALGVPGRRLADLPQRYREIMAQEDLFLIGTPDGLNEAEFQRLQALNEFFKQKCSALASYAIPDTIQHGDLHDGNIFYNAPHYSFYDWGDCSISHPLFSLRTAFVSIENRFQLAEGAPEFQPLSRAYLTAWRDFGTEARLAEALRLAQELWSIGSLLNWYELVSRLQGEARQKYAYTLPALAQEFLGAIKD
jgi:hypothetical protein